MAVAPAWGYLRIHPANPHYLQETTTGEAILVTSFTNIAPTVISEPVSPSFRTDTQAYRMPYCRVWHFLPWGMNDVYFPCAVSSTPGAYRGGLGGNKFDWNTWDTNYWTRMTDSMAQANGAGIYAEVMLFDRVGMSPGSDDRWGNNPWASNNNINNLEVPTANPPNDGTPDFYSYATKPNLRNQQERYVRKMIDSTITYPNVFYEVENEHWDSTDPAWANHYGQFVKDYITANYAASPRLVSYSSLVSDLESLYTSTSIDIINKHFGNSAENNPDVLNTYIEPRWGNNKPINIDEFANGVTSFSTLRQQCWTIITSGGHFHIEDADLASQPYDVVENIRSFKAHSAWDFIHAAPNRNLVVPSTAGYCMAQPGVEYVFYFTTGGSKTVNLAAATYRFEWWNPRTGGFYNVTTIAHGGGNRTISAPDANDWVLHVTTLAAPTTVLNAHPAGGITIDGNPADWNLALFPTSVYAGNTGSGDVAVIGFGGFQGWSCYAGGHWTGGQFPPADPTDHATRVYARHDAGYLYFLVRLDDTDRRTPNPVSSNWANDCVEFYIDPGNTGGASPLSNSTSSVQLDIDAVNQKNVYSTTAGYAAQILSGVTSGVTTDATGWWLEVRIAKGVFNPVIPAANASIGIDFSFRDNDANTNAQTTIDSWHDPEVSATVPTKIPDRWGKLRMSGSIADFDQDGDVDQSDFAHLQTCYTPPAAHVGASCTNADFTGDTAVDQVDLQVFLNCMTGAGQPPGC